MDCEIMELLAKFEQTTIVRHRRHYTAVYRNLGTNLKDWISQIARKLEVHQLDNDGDHAAEVDLRGMRRFAFTRSSSSSRDAFSFGMSPRC